jgi:hypothetical protein
LWGDSDGASLATAALEDLQQRAGVTGARAEKSRSPPADAAATLWTMNLVPTRRSVASRKTCSLSRRIPL